ncbi:hypothetical protein ElyMa_001664400 [Elysia marginata]|uniref:DUF4476 domain-containing protein n=1 Tax=Elysia marginata TaxID=1093978 RepID=A0AAV4JQ46_9GAST|nr:hypothetical protein ElyMa_001664400 [Elysia marginata]
MAKTSMPVSDFETLICRMRQESDSHENKLQILYTSRGYFNAEQAGRILYELPRPADKVSALRMLEPRLCRMTCREARNIIEAVSIHNDRLIALDCVKRVLMDSQEELGEEYSLSNFIYENDKCRGRAIQHTVRSDVADHVPAGGHQGYASLGALHSQARPMLTNLYGDIKSQTEGAPGHGKIHVLPTAEPGFIPSIYTGHPSYAYPPDMSYAETRAYPGTTGYPAHMPTTCEYPGGAPPLGNHSGAPAPTGFQNLEEGKIAV